MRYAIRYSKESEIKFISHLDLMRTIQRIIRRAKLPIGYSKGFNPHMALSIAQPLSVGVHSSGEYMDIVLTEEIDENFIKEAFVQNSPLGIKILDVIKIEQPEEGKKIPQSMALVEAAAYTLKIKYDNTTNLEANLKELLNREEWIALKKSKKGEKEANIKGLIRDFKYEIRDNVLVLDILVLCGSKENLSAALVGRYIKANTEGANETAFVDVKRNDLYTIVEDKFVSIGEFYKQKSKQV